MDTRAVQDGRLARQTSRLRAAVARLGALVTCGVLVLAVSANAFGAGAGESVSGAAEHAEWVQRKLDFTYLGFTTRYSCQGLRDKIRRVLLDLGARRSDLNVHEVGCTRSIGQPEAAPSVGGTFFVLQPAPSSTEHPVEAVWQRVNVRLGRRGLDEAGQCELVDEVRHKILPLFSTRDIQFKQSCIPHQLTPTGSSLSVEVLKPASQN